MSQAPVVNKTVSIDQNYADLLAKMRLLDRQGIAAKCAHCGRTKGDHLPDGRCSTSCLSRSFHNVHHDLRQRIERAVELIEQLLEL